MSATNPLSDGESIEDALRRMSDQAEDALDDIGDDAVGMARRTADAVGGYVREQPWMAVAAGVLVGVVVGALVARRN